MCISSWLIWKSFRRCLDAAVLEICCNDDSRSFEAAGAAYDKVYWLSFCHIRGCLHQRLLTDPKTTEAAAVTMSVRHGIVQFDIPSTYYRSFWRRFYRPDDQTNSTIALKDNG